MTHVDMHDGGASRGRLPINVLILFLAAFLVLTTALVRCLAAAYANRRAHR